MADKLKRRGAGILLHPTSLPGRYGIGDLGPAAHAWLEALARARQTWWQILPLGPTGYGDSPYQSFSAFAGNPYLVSPELLIRDGLLNQFDVASSQFGHFPAERVDYGPVIEFKNRVLLRAWQNFQNGAASILREPFDAFYREEMSWLDDFALFMALKNAHGGKSWQDWPPPLLRREPRALDDARGQH